MNINKLIVRALVVVLPLQALVSCNKYLDKNLVNPNAVTVNSITGKDVFANALVSTVTAVNANTMAGITNQWMGWWARTTSYSASGQQFRVETFSLNNADADGGFWQPLMHNVYDYNFVMSKSAEGSILPGAALAMKVLVFQDLVDVYGNIPYSQAFDPNNHTPAYDKAEDIYANLRVKIDSAMTLLNASKSTADDVADIMFKGDKTKWLKFANTIKLRLLLRQIPNVTSASALQASAAATSSYGYLDAGTDAVINPGFADAPGQQSPFWAGYGFQVATPGKPLNPYQNNTFYVACQTFVDYLKNTKDPRLGSLFNQNAAGGYAGNFFGDGSPTLKPASQLSAIGSGILQSAAMPGVVMTASQALFLQAEAAQRGLIPGVYLTLFNQAVAENFRFLGIANPSAAAASYISSSSDDRVNPAVAANPIKTIIYQKWVANAEVDGLEVWNDYRRTGFPDRTNPSVNPSANTNMVPRRLLYPQSEIDVNTANYKAQNQVAADIYKKIFWGLQ